jgi:IstB-like ATP binding protein
MVLRACSGAAARFGDRVFTGAVIDRLVDYAKVVNRKSDSHRLKDRDRGG